MRSFSKKYLLPALPWFILLYLLTFTYAIFFLLPYFDFQIGSDQEIVTLYVEGSATDLKIGDVVQDFNGISSDSFNEDLLLSRYKNIEIGKSFSLTVKRSEGIIVTEQNAKSFGREEFFARLSSQWWFSYIFWAAGLVTFLSIRPRNTIWQLLIAFFFLISIWMMASSGFSYNHFWGGAIILRVGMLLTFPVIIHLHWNYPTPLNGSNKTPWWIRVSYFLGITGSILQIFQLIPPNLYAFPFLLSLSISIFLLLIRVIKNKEQRRDYSVIALFTFIAILPGIMVSIARTFAIDIPYPLGSLTALSFPLIPLAYLYSINRQKLGQLEFRVNRLISLYLYTILLGTTLLLLLPFLAQVYAISESGTLFAIFSSLTFSLLSIFLYKPFQDLIENRILGIPLNIEDLKRNFAALLNTTLDHEKFKKLIEDKVSASFLIRQSALLEIENKQVSILYMQGVELNHIPEFEEISEYEKYFSRFIQAHDHHKLPVLFNWVKLILPLYFEDNLIGIWGFGRRDPDDFYSSFDIEVLQTLADQLAIAIINHQQAQRLRTLYQQNIDRHETERASLARDLHDDTLNNLALIKHQSSDPKVVEAAVSIISHLRKIIQGLRPEMLTYGGLATALEDLGDLLLERQNSVKIFTDIQSEPTETDENIELHLFRIVQQACENTLQHANAKSLIISGKITPDNIHLLVKDDGIGFSGSTVDFRKLLSEEHYGLAGMHERASLINAKVHIESVPDKGTEIQVIWKK